VKRLSLLAIPLAAVACTDSRAPDVATAYRTLCASCHGVERYGGYAPPLIPAVLERRSDEELREVILRGRPNTQMPAFAEAVAEGQATSLVAWLRRPVERIDWGAGDIATSRVEYAPGEPRIPASVRRENLILVVERNRGNVAVLDGDTLRELDRFQVGRVHGGPKFDVAYRSVVAATRDGTLVSYDLSRGAPRTRVKVGVNTRNIAVSPGGEFVVAANQLPTNLVILDGALNPLRILPLPGQPSGVYQLPGEERFVLALRDVPVLLTIRYPELAVEEFSVPEPFEDFVFVPGRPQLLASSRGGRRILLYDLESREVVGSIQTEGLPHLFSACFFERDGAAYAAVNHIGLPRLSIIDMGNFRVVREIELRGSGYFVRTHPGTPFLWVDTNTEAVQLIHKETFEVHASSLVPEAGKKAMHVEFTAEGDRALVSVWHEEGAVVVYDSTTLEEVERLPYAMPVGKYNAFNKTRFMR
jgi:cytochrome c553